MHRRSLYVFVTLCLSFSANAIASSVATFAESIAERNQDCRTSGGLCSAVATCDADAANRESRNFKSGSGMRHAKLERDLDSPRLNHSQLPNEVPEIAVGDLVTVRDCHHARLAIAMRTAVLIDGIEKMLACRTR